MARRISIFQTILSVLAGVAIVVAVLMFAFSKGKNKEASLPVTMWGTLHTDVMRSLTENVRKEGIELGNIQYVQKDISSIESEYVEALAEGRAPDIIMLREDQLIANTPRIYTIPYESYPVRNFKDNFIEAGDLFLNSKGTLAIPFTVDPLVMYWNKNLFSNAGITRAPQYWDEVMSIVPSLTQKDSSLNVRKSAIAFGEFQNVNHAKEILLNLIIQAGSDVIVRSSEEDRTTSEYNVILNERLGYTVPPTQAALTFYTQFANPSKDVYSWNRSLSRSDERFIAGDLAMYFGFSSELPKLREKNPNLNFDVGMMPQSRSSEVRKVYAHMNGLAISRTTDRLSSAFNTINDLTNPVTLKILSDITGLPPVRRDLIESSPEDPNKIIFARSALWARGALDPDASATETIYKNMVESFVTGRLSVTEAISRATLELKTLFK